MRFVDLFSGMGGFHRALADLGHECVFASEVDSELRNLYARNFSKSSRIIHGDLRECKGKVPPHDVLCAGFPCQPFSKSGSQNGTRDTTRGTLFNEIVEVLSRRRPKYVILENVGNFERHNEEKLSFDKAASEVGETSRTVRENYRNYRVTKQTRLMGIDTTRVRAKFGVFTRAMQDSHLRQFIGAVPAADIKRGQSGFNDTVTAKARVRDLVSWVFGTEGEEPLITDSRKISELGQVVSNKAALKELRETRNLETAFS